MPADDDSFDDSFDDALRAMARAPDVIPIDARVAHFRIVERIGSGGMGVVYRAEDETLRRTVALKVLPDAGGDDERRLRFLREARSAAAITHPNVATVYQVGEAEGRVYIAMELVEGENLRERMQRGRIDLATAKDLALQIARGLAAAHEKGIVHRDLKPENVMITPSGQVKLLDFGLAKVGVDTPVSGRTEAALAKTETLVTSDEGRVMGTPEYMSPEQALGEPLDVRSDVFSFGIVLYEILSGSRPFAGGNTGAVIVAIIRDQPPLLRERVAEIDDDIVAIVERCLAKPASERWASGKALVQALDGKMPLRATSASATDSLPGETVVAPTSSSRVRLLAGALALVITALITSWRASHRVASDAPSPVRAASPATADGGAGRVIRIVDLAAPKTDSPAALVAYRDGLRDVYDAAREPIEDFSRATREDPGFSAAYLRNAFNNGANAAQEAYRQAVRNRDRLDARDTALLHAEEAVMTDDLPEAVRRYSALHEQQPLDIEVYYRLANLVAQRDPAAAIPLYEDILRLDARFAGAEASLAGTLRQLGREEDARSHLQRCNEISPQAGVCILALSAIESQGGRCEAYATAARRVATFDPTSISTLDALMNATFTTEAGRDAAESVARRVEQAPFLANMDASMRATVADQVEGDIALWFGDLAVANARFDRALKVYASLGLPFLYQQLEIVEEIGDETQLAAMLRQYVGARATKANLWGDDGKVLRDLREHHVTVGEPVDRIRGRWRSQVQQTGIDPLDLWLYEDVNSALTPSEAREALGRADGGLPPLNKVDPNSAAIVGRALLLAGRAADAVPFLERAAKTCRVVAFFAADSRAADINHSWLLLGQARETLGDPLAACFAYGRVLSHWGGARPRSITAEAARARAKALSCP